MVESANTSGVDQELVARLCVEYWKLVRASQRAAQQLPDKDGKRMAAQLKFSDLQLATISGQLGLNLVSFDGEQFSVGMPASADNGEDFGQDEDLVVTKTIEPAVVREMKVVHKGRVLVARRSDEEREE
ncbi:hypothetical protein [Rhodobacter maris]|uniref:Uncharacterized protein n=1 Tax=Rhodobacter maris TaxID=446682 RepID=A0A285RS27_9RHOB|nr:hypothetical protein [Rhodobacter maris]SOB95212.1 hypothetical protein SAMN05877831_101847 [Rhodobacter maris]